MPDYPKIPDDLYAEVQRRLMPRPYTPYPRLERAIEKLRKTYPADMAGVDIQAMDFDNPYSFSDVSGATNMETGKIRINPALPMGFPQAASENTLAHELEHSRQFKRGETTQYAGPGDYDKNPTEAEAFGATRKYAAKVGNPLGHRATLPGFTNQLPDPIMMQLAQRFLKRNPFKK